MAPSTVTTTADDHTGPASALNTSAAKSIGAITLSFRTPVPTLGRRSATFDRNVRSWPRNASTTAMSRNGEAADHPGWLTYLTNSDWTTPISNPPRNVRGSEDRRPMTAAARAGRIRRGNWSTWSFTFGARRI